MPTITATQWSSRWTEQLHAITGHGVSPRDAGILLGTHGISPDEAAHVLHCCGERGGYEPGRFIACLLQAMTAADSDDLRQLGSRYPGYASAVWLARHHREGFRALQALATCAG